MRDPELREWRALIRERADREWRELSPDVVEELASHLAELHAAALARGASETDARARALDALNAASFGEVSKRPRARHAPTGYVQDVRLAVRQMRASPLVSAAAILSLALGIGANTAIFSLVNSLLLRPLPVREPQQLVTLTQGSWTNPIWEQIRDRHELFDSACAWSETVFNLASGGETEFVDGIWASGSLFETLGVDAMLGRTFTVADDRRGGGPDGPVAVIGYAFWQRRFGGAADVVGRTLVVERVPFTVIGVTPPDFLGPEVGRTFDVAIPLGDEPIVRGRGSYLDQRSTWWLSIMARLKREQSLDAANAALRAVQPSIRDATAPGWNNYIPEPFTLAPAATGESQLRRRYERPLIVVLTIVALVLVIACANIANLLLARATARHHEFSVRRALGASRWRLARQLIAESAVLSAAGAIAGVVVARWGSQFLVQQISTRTERVVLDLSIDTRVLLFTIGVTIATTLLFGVVPALRVAASEPMAAIKEYGRGASRRRGLSGSLVVAQVALSLVLVVAATLFVRTFTSLANQDLGFNRDRVLVVNVNADRAPIDRTARLPVFERVLDRVRVLPGVVDAGLSRITPVSGQGWNTEVDVSDAPRLNGRQALTFRNAITPRWLATLDMRLVAGRAFTDADRKGAPPVVIVNQAFVRRFLNGRDPIGRTVQRRVMFNRNQPNASPPPPAEIVGVMADAVYSNLREPVPPTMFEPLEQSEEGALAGGMALILRTAGSPMADARSIASAIRDVDANLSITFRPLAELVNASVTRERIVAMLAGFFGALALLLASLGLFGLTSYTVERRRTEIGIRMALGAAPSGVIGLVLSGTTGLIAIGIILGGTLSLWAARFVGALLYQVEARDPATLVSAAAMLAAIGAIAAALPAYRASRIDPAVVLREGQA
ncbi:MAG TPA: ABC transporter permease [Vicinamibacterales bacterium]